MRSNQRKGKVVRKSEEYPVGHAYLPCGSSSERRRTDQGSDLTISMINLGRSNTWVRWRANCLVVDRHAGLDQTVSVERETLLPGQN